MGGRWESSVGAPPARDRGSAPASPDRVCACLSMPFMIEELLLLLLLLLISSLSIRLQRLWQPSIPMSDSLASFDVPWDFSLMLRWIY